VEDVIPNDAFAYEDGRQVTRHLDGAKGTGARVGGRPCGVVIFTKQ